MSLIYFLSKFRKSFFGDIASYTAEVYILDFFFYIYFHLFLMKILSALCSECGLGDENGIHILLINVVMNVLRNWDDVEGEKGENLDPDYSFVIFIFLI
jgi:hypothetical protein